MKKISEELSASTYPGRGIIIGMSPSGKYAITAYFIMGRSTNSRNRIFMQDGDGIRTQAFDPSLLEDPSLIIYAPVRILDEHTIVTNGDQTDTIVDLMKSGLTFEDALETREYEPDAPNFTPRISGIMTIKDGKFSYKLSILKSDAHTHSVCERFTYSYKEPIKGEAHFIHTYMQDGSPLPSFAGEPELIGSMEEIDAFTEECWNSLNEDNKISLFTRFIDIETGEAVSRIINKNV